MSEAAPRPPSVPTQPRPEQPPRNAPVHQLTLPERPKLAPGVELRGQMKESAFKDPPWLIEREGSGFVQVTQLIYQVAEQANGQNTYAQIAQNLTEAGTPVSAATIQNLVAQLLIPRGLVAAGDGSVAEVAHAASPLALNFRMKMLSPRFIDPVTAVLKYLYFPPILVAVLIAAALSQAWLFFVHGVARSIQDVLYDPSLFLLLVAVLLFSTSFHEFGHASALRYGGGQVRGMGFGIYLVYPAFYTDVTDNYRLGRWARVRTDLGGFYFNLIFGLLATGVYFLTHIEFILLIVILVDMDIVRQVLPFVRLDGYWALADLTGIPDFFSEMGAFLRSVVPFLKRSEGKPLPPLKWWGKAVFGLYIVIVVPLLAFLLFIMLKGVPRVLATGWDSLRKHGGEMIHYGASGNFFGVAASALQLFALGLSMLGLGYTLYSFGRIGLTLMWRWSQGSSLRRVGGVAATMAIVGFIAFLWMPQLSLGARPSSAHAETVFRPISPKDRGTIGEVAPNVIPPVVAWAPDVPSAPPPALAVTTSRPGSTDPSISRASDKTGANPTGSGAGRVPTSTLPSATSVATPPNRGAIGGIPSSTPASTPPGATPSPLSTPATATPNPPTPAPTPMPTGVPTAAPAGALAGAPTVVPASRYPSPTTTAPTPGTAPSSAAASPTAGIADTPTTVPVASGTATATSTSVRSAAVAALPTRTSLAAATSVTPTATSTPPG